MAEAHSAVAFSFAVSHEGLHINVNHDALWAVWESGVRSWKKKIGRIKVCVQRQFSYNKIQNTIKQLDRGPVILTTSRSVFK